MPKHEGGGMVSERRRFKRFDVPLDVRFKFAGNTSEYFSGTTINFSREGLCFESTDTVPKLNEPIELKVQVPKKNSFAFVLGDVVWKAQTSSKSLAGVRFSEIDKAIKSEILDYAYDLWVEKSRD